MKRKILFAAAAMLLTASILAGCGPAATPAMTLRAATEAPAQAAPAESDALGSGAPAPVATAFVAQTGPGETTSNLSYGDRLIVKNGNIRLLVRDTDIALDGVTQLVGDVRGYIVSSRVWYQDYYGKNYKYAALTIGVPVEEFENSLRRLRGLSLRVLDEQASGEDVTDQYVDLESQLRNLEATRDRIKGFLDQAKTVDEALRINKELSDIEAQIEQIKGKMNYLTNRSAFSTITINIEPDLPAVVATPTPTPTPAPIQPLRPWDPGRTVLKAENALVAAYRVIIDLLIWVFLVLVPIFAPPALVIWLIVWLVRRKPVKPTGKK